MLKSSSNVSKYRIYTFTSIRDAEIVLLERYQYEIKDEALWEEPLISLIQLWAP